MYGMQETIAEIQRKDNDGWFQNGATDERSYMELGNILEPKRTLRWIGCYGERVKKPS